MKIAQVEPFPVSYPEPNDFNALRHLCLAKITADDGQVGWGESITQFPEANFAAKAIIEGMAPNLHRQGPGADRGALAAEQATRPGGTATTAASRPIAIAGDRHRALGPQGQGARRERARPARRPGPRAAAGDRLVPRALRVDPGEMAEETAGWVSTGLQGVKIGFGKRGNARLGYEHDRDVEYVRPMREAIGAGQVAS